MRKLISCVALMLCFSAVPLALAEARGGGFYRASLHGVGFHGGALGRGGRRAGYQGFRDIHRGGLQHRSYGQDVGLGAFGTAPVEAPIVYMASPNAEPMYPSYGSAHGYDAHGYPYNPYPGICLWQRGREGQGRGAFVRVCK
jgi:hypothetical protein